MTTEHPLSHMAVCLLDRYTAMLLSCVVLWAVCLCRAYGGHRADSFEHYEKRRAEHMSIMDIGKPVVDIEAQRARAAGYARRSRRDSVPASVRRAVLDRSQGMCEARMPGCTLYAKDLHHLIAKAEGGKDTAQNLAHVCEPCHKRIEREKFDKSNKCLTTLYMNVYRVYTPASSATGAELSGLRGTPVNFADVGKILGLTSGFNERQAKAV